MREFQFYVYILASNPYGTLYTGVTNNLDCRVLQHKNDVFEGFTKRYGVHRLVWFEEHDDILLAIEREKRIKRWRRSWKISLIEGMNPTWDDLHETVYASHIST